MAMNPGRFTKPRNMDVLARFQDAPKEQAIFVELTGLGGPVKLTYETGAMT